MLYVKRNLGGEKGGGQYIRESWMKMLASYLAGSAVHDPDNAVDIPVGSAVHESCQQSSGTIMSSACMAAAYHVYLLFLAIGASV